MTGWSYFSCYTTCFQAVNRMPVLKPDHSKCCRHTIATSWFGWPDAFGTLFLCACNRPSSPGSNDKIACWIRHSKVPIFTVLGLFSLWKPSTASVSHLAMTKPDGSKALASISRNDWNFERLPNFSSLSFGLITFKTLRRLQAGSHSFPQRSTPNNLVTDSKMGSWCQ